MSSPNFVFTTDPYQPTQAINYNGQIYYSRSAPTTPYGQPAVLLPTPPVAVSPLPNVWYPQWPNTPGNLPVPLPNAAPVLLDVLNPSQGWAQRAPPTIFYDLRDHPARAQVASHPKALLSRHHLQAGVTSPPMTSIKIVSKLFPWEIDVQSENGNSPVSVEDLITAVHETLWKHITGSEWWIVTDDVRTKVSAAYAKNCDVSSAGESRKHAVVDKPRHKKEGLRRVDWLLDNVVMKGLERDDKFVASRIRDPEVRSRTWVLVTGPL